MIRLFDSFYLEQKKKKGKAREDRDIQKDTKMTPMDKLTESPLTKLGN